MSQPLIIAHRGSNDHFPEHSLAAYRQAVAENADGFECDVRLSLDGHLVLHHDRNARRTAGDRRNISDMTLEELRALNFAKKHPAQADDPASARIPTFEEFLDLVEETNPHLKLLIETKHPTRFGMRVEEEVFKSLRRRPHLDAVVMSFSRAALRHWRAEDKETPLVWLFEYPFGSPPAEINAYGPRLEFVRADPSFIAQAKDANKDVFIWTVNTPKAAKEMRGADMLITDKPGMIKASL
ncbi:glycerophosphodiester phosphodiesterase [Natronoglycomyces albus]|uniref:GP-PDE domain-containing protein n=1 Tax=Natronoglycomyces albus TaxID=2811108 RepID=A0A895XRY8_9ACTN|nr:glycerophosphodiester phosphodiesterase family protein [Natronoglycomyces albus]QSB05326.1 hypothetical protein JQS30_16515 [Natronoglycomyces albus]